MIICDSIVKVRAIDDETASGANLCTEGGGKIVCHGLDALTEMIKLLGFRSGGFKKLSLWKADIKAAYRRIPIRKEDRWLAWIVLLVNGKPTLPDTMLPCLGRVVASPLGIESANY